MISEVGAICHELIILQHIMWLSTACPKGQLDLQTVQVAVIRHVDDVASRHKLLKAYKSC